MFNYCLPLTIEEQAIMVLYDRIERYIHDSNKEAVVKAIKEVIGQLGSVWDSEREAEQNEQSQESTS